MPKFLRGITLVLLPVITLALGWELGITYEQKRLHKVNEQLEFLYTGSTDSGRVISDPEDEVNFALLYGIWRL
ncbi:MAG: hypothetical protein KAS32_29835, partial [Candidatus Peribacteraceae bacterium]|nr:hypothetical protein [Candidatus Peribacteraceae bacterium]